MLKCGSLRGQFIQTREQHVSVRELHTHVLPGPKAVSRGEAPRLTYTTRLVKTFEHSSVVQCLDWSPSGETFALGSQDGSVAIYSPITGSEAIEIPARQQRACKSVKYRSSSVLAIGHDKVRSDFSLTIHDLVAEASVGSFAHSEAVSSLCWLPSDPYCVLAGLNQRWLRLIDTRIQAKESYTIMSTPTLAVYEITASFDNVTFASTHDNNILIWDRRKADTPILSLKSNATSASCRVNQLRFSPKHTSTVAALSNDGNIDFWSLQTAHNNAESFPEVAVERQESSKLTK